LKLAGVNRLSIGMQSSSPSVLKTLDRTHQPESVKTAVVAARDNGMQVSVDLIYGTPGETMQEWEQSLRDAIALETDHLSAYSLIVEPGTALHRKIRSGGIPDVDEDLHAEAYEIADRMLKAAGFEWYEISNWAKGDSKVSRHNRAYWTGGDWWGYGPGAHSHLNGARWWNVKHPAAFAERLAAGNSPALERELLSPKDRQMSDASAREIPTLIAEELIDGRKAIAGTIALTDRGRLLADLVVRRLT
jgi:oxygen-independent coproporphyrinogen-3 oxidase